MASVSGDHLHLHLHLHLESPASYIVSPGITKQHEEPHENRLLEPKGNHETGAVVA
jgi:hypothetical protein